MIITDLHVSSMPVVLQESSPQKVKQKCLFPALFEGGFIDAAGWINEEKFRGIEFPPLNESMIRELLTRAIKTYKGEIKLEEYLQYVQAYYHIDSIEIVGGFVRRLVLLSAKEAFEKIGIEIDDELIESCKEPLSDYDIRINASQTNPDELRQLMVRYLSMAAFKSVEPELVREIIDHAFTKFTLVHKGDTHFSITSFNDIEILYVKSLARSHLFASDSLRVNLKDNSLVSDYLGGWQAIIDILTKRVHITDLETINEDGPSILMSRIARGYTCEQHEPFQALCERGSTPFLLQKCLTNHYRNDPDGAFAVLFNARTFLKMDIDFSSFSLEIKDPVLKVLYSADFESAYAFLHIVAFLNLESDRLKVNLINSHLQIRFGNCYLLQPLNLEEAFKKAKEFPELDHLFPDKLCTISDELLLGSHLLSRWIRYLLATQNGQRAYSLWKRSKLKEMSKDMIHGLAPTIPSAALSILKEGTYGLPELSAVIAGYQNNVTELRMSSIVAVVFKTVSGKRPQQALLLTQDPFTFRLIWILNQLIECPEAYQIFTKALTNRWLPENDEAVQKIWVSLCNQALTTSTDLAEKYFTSFEKKFKLSRDAMEFLLSLSERLPAERTGVWLRKVNITSSRMENMIVRNLQSMISAHKYNAVEKDMHRITELKRKDILIELLEDQLEQGETGRAIETLKQISRYGLDDRVYDILERNPDPQFIMIPNMDIARILPAILPLLKRSHFKQVVDSIKDCEMLTKFLLQVQTIDESCLWVLEHVSDEQVVSLLTFFEGNLPQRAQEIVLSLAERGVEGLGPLLLRCPPTPLALRYVGEDLSLSLDLVAHTPETSWETALSLARKVKSTSDTALKRKACARLQKCKPALLEVLEMRIEIKDKSLLKEENDDPVYVRTLLLGILPMANNPTILCNLLKKCPVPETVFAVIRFLQFSKRAMQLCNEYFDILKDSPELPLILEQFIQLLPQESVLIVNQGEVPKNDLKKDSNKTLSTNSDYAIFLQNCAKVIRSDFLFKLGLIDCSSIGESKNWHLHFQAIFAVVGNPERAVHNLEEFIKYSGRIPEHHRQNAWDDALDYAICNFVNCDRLSPVLLNMLLARYLNVECNCKMELHEFIPQVLPKHRKKVKKWLYTALELVHKVSPEKAPAMVHLMLLQSNFLKTLIIHFPEEEDTVRKYLRAHLRQYILLCVGDESFKMAQNLVSIFLNGIPKTNKSVLAHRLFFGNSAKDFINGFSECHDFSEIVENTYLINRSLDLLKPYFEEFCKICFETGNIIEVQALMAWILDASKIQKHFLEDDSFIHRINWYMETLWEISRAFDKEVQNMDIVGFKTVKEYGLSPKLCWSRVVESHIKLIISGTKEQRLSDYISKIDLKKVKLTNVAERLALARNLHFFKIDHITNQCIIEELEKPLKSYLELQSKQKKHEEIDEIVEVVNEMLSFRSNEGWNWGHHNGLSKKKVLRMWSMILSDCNSSYLKAKGAEVKKLQPE